MQDIQYIGEHTLFQQFGIFFVFLSFTAAIASAVSYFISNKDSNASWLRLGRAFFRMHSIGVIGVVALMFAMLYNSWYEFSYVWEHRNNEMPIQYILSCFWEGQEGSFLLWTFWNVIIGSILIRTAKEWENSSMTVFSVIQIFLTSMILGVYVLDYKMGSNPFTLIRELPENLGLPWTTMEDYLTRFPQFLDGRGLNPLLQNYWMVIHPPIVMLGFALTAIPFSFAIGGLWRDKLSEWIRPALPWAFAGIGILGGGLLMGGAWAYEALSFGGFWAWDPVENASLVPWLTLVGGAHVMLVNRNQPKSLFSAFFLILSTFILIIYSTFLTRSGVLGESSVHSFTGNGMIEQLMIFLVFFITIATGMLTRNGLSRIIYFGFALFCLLIGFFSDRIILWMFIFVVATFVQLIFSYVKFFPKANEEEHLWSREFWLFVGAMVLLMSASQIIFYTSRPVFNYLAEPLGGIFSQLGEVFNSSFFSKLSQGNLADESQDQLKHNYNKFQVPFAMFITFFMGFAQYLRYRKTPKEVLRKAFILPLILSLVITALFIVFFDWSEYMDFVNFHFGSFFYGLVLILLVFTSAFTIMGNVGYMVDIIKGKWDMAGSSIAHIGFGLVILGALISTAQSKKISQNILGNDIRTLSESFNNNEDMLLYKGDTLFMENYFVSFQKKYKEGINQNYVVEYFDVSKKEYKKDDLIIHLGAVFKALRDHEADVQFLSDFEQNWSQVNDIDHLDLNTVTRWVPYKKGKKLFELEPRIQLNERFGNVPEPDTKHYLNKDIYTHVRYGDLASKEPDNEGYQERVEHKVLLKDSIQIKRAVLIVDSLRTVDSIPDVKLDTNGIAIKCFTSIAAFDTIFIASPTMILQNSGIQSIEDEISELGIKIGFTDLNIQSGEITITTSLHEDINPDFIVMQAIVFPLINVLWLGSILMVLGTFMAVRQRIRTSKKNEE